MKKPNVSVQSRTIEPASIAVNLGGIGMYAYC